MPTNINAKDGDETPSLSVAGEIVGHDLDPEAVMEQTESGEEQLSMDGAGNGVNEDNSNGLQTKRSEWGETNVEKNKGGNKDNSVDEDSESFSADLNSGGAGENEDDEESMANGSTMAWKTGDTSSKQTDSGDEARIGYSLHHQSFLSGSGTSVMAKPTSFRNKKQDEFVKKGARARALLTTALRAVADGFASNSALVDLCGDAVGDERDKSGGIGATVGNDDDEGPRKTWNAKTDFAHVQDLAQKNAEECMSLKRKLQESHCHIEVLQNENSASQQSNTQFKEKIDRISEALQIAGGNAANARAEADASNARAESLSCQLNNLQSVIEETKRGMEVVRREHDEVSRAARSVEGRLIQVESELTRAARAKKDAVEERDFLKARADKAEKLARELQDSVDYYHDERRVLKKDLLEMEELGKARSDRTHRMETEFQEARAGLLEATSAAAEAESTVTSLRSVIEELRRENESMHEQMNESRDILSKDRAKQNEALTLAEREAQKWKMKCGEADEEARKLKMDKSSAEKTVDQLKSRVANMERRINDSSKQFSRTEKTPPEASTITPHSSSNLGLINAFGANDGSIVSEENNKRKYVADLPQRESSKAQPNSSSRHLTYSYQKENKSTVNMQDQLQRNESFYGGGKKKPRTNKCCLCSKEGGMILSCQCDKINCDKRAHAICIGKFRSGKNGSKRTILCGED